MTLYGQQFSCHAALCGEVLEQGSSSNREQSFVEWGEIPFVCPSIQLSFHLTVRQSIYPSIHLTVHLSKGGLTAS